LEDVPRASARIGAAWINVRKQPVTIRQNVVV
jgi:hypothetical protein